MGLAFILETGAQTRSICAGVCARVCQRGCPTVTPSTLQERGEMDWVGTVLFPEFELKPQAV